MVRRSRFRVRRRARSVLTSFIASVGGVLQNPTFMLGIAAAFYFKVDSTYLDKIITAITNVEVLKPIGTYLSNHKDATIGYLALGSSSFAAPAAYSFVLLLVTGFLSYEVIPTTTKLYEYVVLGVLLTLFFRLRSTRNRIVLGIAAAAVVASGWLTVFNKVTTTTTTTKSG